MAVAVCANWPSPAELGSTANDLRGNKAAGNSKKQQKKLEKLLDTTRQLMILRGSMGRPKDMLAKENLEAELVAIHNVLGAQGDVSEPRK